MAKVKEKEIKFLPFVLEIDTEDEARALCGAIYYYEADQDDYVKTKEINRINNARTSISNALVDVENRYNWSRNDEDESGKEG